MSQQDTPRFAEILGRYRALIGVMAALGLLAGAVFAALNPPVYTSQALVQFPTSWSCPPDAICGGPAFAPERPDYAGARLLQSLAAGVQIKPLAGNVLMLTATAGTPAKAEATAAAASRSYLAYAEALSYPGDQTAQILEPATAATGTPPLIRLRDDALLGALFGLLVGVIAALAGGATTMATPTAPRGYDTGEVNNLAGQETRYVSADVSFQQLAREYVNGRAAPGGTLPNMFGVEPF